MIWIVNAEITGDYPVKVKFNDGLSGIIDFKKNIEKIRNDTSKYKVTDILNRLNAKLMNGLAKHTERIFE